MKKILPSFIGLILSFNYAGAVVVTNVKSETVLRQISLQSEPLDLEVTGRPQTIFISPKTVYAGGTNVFRSYSDSFELSIDPNKCETSQGGATCTEMGSMSYVAKFGASEGEILLFNESRDSRKLHQIKLANRRTGEPINLSIAKIQIANDPGKPYFDLYLVAKDSTGERRAKLHAQLRN